ncbi:hypothetical protein [Rufibacter quisquiliarum]|uniref:Uncharacterized protein n=1 Tax=Rufibacter quisquiliarum TaxID=1549639 RepID=A0A839GQG1_9BACT|nr:hypothetical protein [Rufibacter quisquiliarum]MBA9076071.1 hypothetical protein [Rufibacter quisquiliarum]
MAKLTKSIRKENGYALGGLTQILAFATFLANGITPSATLTFGADGLVSDIDLNEAVKPVLIESEEDKANFTDNLAIGAGRYKTQTLGFNLAGMSAAKSKALEDIDLVKHSYVVRAKSGKYFLLGAKNGLIASQNNAGVGAGVGDANGYDIIVGGAENGPALEVSEAAWAALSLLVPADV